MCAGRERGHPWWRSRGRENADEVAQEDLDLATTARPADRGDGPARRGTRRGCPRPGGSGDPLDRPARDPARHGRPDRAAGRPGSPAVVDRRRGGRRAGRVGTRVGGGDHAQAAGPSLPGRADGLSVHRVGGGLDRGAAGRPLHPDRPGRPGRPRRHAEPAVAVPAGGGGVAVAARLQRRPYRQGAVRRRRVLPHPAAGV